MKKLLYIFVVICSTLPGMSCKKDSSSTGSPTDFRSALEGNYSGTMKEHNVTFNGSAGFIITDTTYNYTMTCSKVDGYPSAKMKIGNNIYEIHSDGTYEVTGSPSPVSIKMTEHSLKYSVSGQNGVASSWSLEFNGSK